MVMPCFHLGASEYPEDDPTYLSSQPLDILFITVLYFLEQCLSIIGIKQIPLTEGMCFSLYSYFVAKLSEGYLLVN